jgi:hypothetical protein
MDSPAVTSAFDPAAFIAKHKWTFAKTMPKWPHEYVVRQKVDDDESFNAFVMLIRRTGTAREWHGRIFTYLKIDGWEYWTMGSPLDQTTIINRARPT